MRTLLLRLAGPMQSWGTDSKFDIRRSCPPAGRVFLGIAQQPLESALRSYAPAGQTRLVVDAEDGAFGKLVRDVPVSFDPERREYAYRRVKECFLPERDHDPFEELEG